MADTRKMPRIPFYKLVASGVDLASAFKSTVDAFNARDLTTLMNLCDDDIVVVGVKRQNHYCGKQAVSGFFADQFRANKPTFTPTTSDTTINPTGTVGHIIGAAEWTDYDPNDPQVLISIPLFTTRSILSIVEMGGSSRLCGVRLII